MFCCERMNCDRMSPPHRHDILDTRCSQPYFFSPLLKISKIQSRCIGEVISRSFLSQHPINCTISLRQSKEQPHISIASFSEQLSSAFLVHLIPYLVFDLFPASSLADIIYV